MAAPELRLNVSLDLGFFRQQLQKLTVVAQSEFAPKLNVKFNKQTLDRELNNLQSAIKRRVYRVEIGGNIDRFPEKIESIRQQLASLETQNKIEVPVSVRNGVTKKDATSVIAAAYKTIRTSGLENTGGKIRIPVSIRPAITKADVSAFKKAVKESLGGISIDIKANVKGGDFAGSAQGAAGLMEYMRTQGMVGKTASGMEMRMGNEGGKIQRSALDQLARAVFFMAGIDPARVRAEQAERRRIPDINWQATTSPRAPFTGPSSTGRALPPGITPASLPGTAFASQKRLVGDILSPSLKDAVRGAANTFVDSIRQGLNDAVRSVRVRDLGNALRPALTGSRVAGFLPAGVGRSPQTYAGPAQGGPSWVQRASARAEEAYRRSALREMDVLGGGAGRPSSSYSYAYRAARPQGAIVPYAAGGAMVPSGGGGRGSSGFPSDEMMGGRQGPATFIGAGSQMKKFKTALDMASTSAQNFRASQIPLIGGIRSLAGEFGEATKQVLLYGTAYKGLAFITSLPGQILNAAKSQQQFNNALQTATQDTGTFAKELLYVDNVQRAFGLNLETTRTGFTRLYASMAPTGFDSGSIEKLFTGISAATAALQLTPDKAERVIYAFGQMASKGQIMSEELKGQLGDVLPGALAIFSKAAGMSVKEFSKAMEDGEFTGNRFREVFAKVSDELMNRFGTGAAAAGKSLQGLLNTVGGDFQRTLESFAPLANAAAQAVLGPLSGALREISAAAQIAMGEQDRVRKQLEAAQSDVSALRTGGADAKEIKAAEQNVAALTARYEALNEAAKDPAIAQQVKNIEAFVTEIQKAATFTMNLAGIIGNVLNPLFTLLGGNLTSVVGNLALLALGFNAVRLVSLLTMGTMATMNAIVAAGGSISTAAAAKHTLLAGVFKLVGIQATGAQVATIGFGLAIKGLLISTGIGALVVLLGSLAASALSVGDAFSAAAAKTKQSMDEMKDAVRTGNVALAKSQLSTATQSRNAIEEQVKYLNEMQSLATGKGRPFVQTSLARRLMLEQAGFDLKGKTELDLNDLQKQIPKLRADALNLEQRGRVSIQLAQKQAKTIGLDKPDPTAAIAAEEDIKDKKKTSLESYYSLQDQLAKNFTQAEIDRQQAMHDQRMALQNEFFNQQEARANSFQKEAIKFQRELASIENERKTALLKASQELMKAQGSVAGGATGASTTGATGLLQGSTGISSADHFDVRRQDGSYISPEQAKALFDTSVRGRLAMTSAYGPRRAPVPGASTFHRGVDLAGPANTPLNLAAGYTMVGQGEKGGLGYAASVRGPQGEMYDVGHLQRPKAGAGAPRKVPGSEKRDLVAAQQVQIANSQQITIGLNAEQLAYEKTKTAIANYVASIFSPEEQALQNSLLAKRGELISAGMDDDAIELEMKRYEIQEKVNIGLADAKKLLEDKAISQEAYNDLVAKLKNLLPTSNKLLGEQNALLRENAYKQRITDLKEQIRLLRIINDEERRLAELAKEFKGDTAKAQEVFDLEKIKKNIEDTRALIDGFVSQTSSDYKGFLKAVISGEDAVDALKQFQEGLKDRVLTIFLDFAMAPIEKFFKESLERLFLPKEEKLPGTEIDKEITKDPVEATNSNTNATNVNTEAINNLTNALSTAGASGAEQATSPLNAAMQSIGGVAFDTSVGAAPMEGFDAASVFGDPEALKGSFAGLQGSLSQSMSGISSSFEAATFSIAETLPSWNDALAVKLPGSLTKATNDTNAKIPSFQESLGKVAQGIGIAAGTIMGIASGIGQIKKGGTSNILGGIGSILMSIGGGIGGFLNLGKAANGAVWKGGFQAFANGGMVTSPTLGLVGEGKYNEAIVPLPDGRSIPVQMTGATGGSLRDAMGGGLAQNSTPVLSMSFQSTNINGVEYVSRDQLEQAMAQTRRDASRDGAKRGMTMTLDKLQQSPSTRSRIGIR